MKRGGVCMVMWIADPVQFMVTCLQLANYSVPTAAAAAGVVVVDLDELGLEGRLALLDDMQTVAVRDRSTTRFLALRWLVWAYICRGGGGGVSRNDRDTNRATSGNKTTESAPSAAFVLRNPRRATLIPT
ncbi:hypothetical protein N657DRAFT_638388 [Parathielavia appendiculata]|uniref:Secreted protein n=1 Tax=Parathielavia appendiculata TaxID=2587402 RepID=A0AAN6TNX2_9PEZI|nr:hypothetical protein N657DRAFT_638388 [Parathielavia appendiculata]